MEDADITLSFNDNCEDYDVAYVPERETNDMSTSDEPEADMAGEDTMDGRECNPGETGGEQAEP